MQSKKGILITGAIVGVISSLLVYFGNPANMGFCIACFLRDIAGGIGLHRAQVVQYIRPEIVGLVLGAFIIALKNKEFKSRGGSAPFTRFILAIVVMIGALMFLGCPLRMVLRLGGGDLNALFGIAGFVVGILVGVYFLNKGFNLKRNYKLPKFEGYLLPIVSVGLFALLVVAPAFIFFSEKGPGAAHAAIWIALAAGLIVGVLAQKTRLCMVGGTRDMILFKDNYLLLGFIAIIVFSFIANLAFGFFNLGFENQPVAHTDGLWNFLGMALVGWASVLLGGCPLRQLILSGEGNSDSAVTVIGMIVGAAICHNFGLAASPKGPTLNGQIAVGICVVVLLIISYFNTEFITKKE
ncbi:YedE-related selenium metabolism membrane protein [Clostridium sp. 'deep sea']|uniref:YedE family putative selenium transporter n=1 Tax=Clostridium sp. 'deep sea' TaxID=2779445 RepID=UPI001896465C|nr:YedE family putative selenium transporter [Clostridium sp. 'deep sea']QOR35206.1 YedE-related selenium metabolism membrane protein [Clostridium sp. 'deep sea']